MRKTSPFFSISFRLLLFNLLIAFVPVAATLFLSTFEDQILQSLEHALVQQGRVMAAALGDTEALDSMNAAAIIRRMERRHDARIRVLDTTGRVLADSSVLPPESGTGEGAAESVPKWADPLYSVSVRSMGGGEDIAAGNTAAARDAEESGARGKDPSSSFLYRVASLPVRLMRDYLLPPAVPIESGDFYLGQERLLGSEVQAALEGRYGAATRISSGGQVSVTLYSALPVTCRGTVTGVVLVSQSTYRILQNLYRLRLDIFRIFLLSILAAVIISLFLSFSIARPIKTLNIQAGKAFAPGGKLEGRFSVGRRRDEIGQLALSLDRLSGQLREHIGFIESFASDVSHKLKNPIAAIRSSAEVVSDAVGENGDAARFLAIIQREAARMEGLITDLRDISTIDTRLRHEEKEPVDVAALAERMAEEYGLRSRPIRVLFRPEPAGGTRQSAVVYASPLRLGQVMANIMDNAVSFSPPGSEVTVTAGLEGERVFFRVRDRGPGIPTENLERIFDRFYTYRTGDRDGRHAGLGLAIVKAIVTGYGGTVSVENAEGGGACFTVRFPAGIMIGNPP